MFCNQCGAKQPENTKFCYKCGNKIVQPDIIQTPSVIQASDVVQMPSDAYKLTAGSNQTVTEVNISATEPKEVQTEPSIGGTLDKASGVPKADNDLDSIAVSDVAPVEEKNYPAYTSAYAPVASMEYAKDTAMPKAPSFFKRYRRFILAGLGLVMILLWLFVPVVHQDHWNRGQSSRTAIDVFEWVNWSRGWSNQPGIGRSSANYTMILITGWGSLVGHIVFAITAIIKKFDITKKLSALGLLVTVAWGFGAMSTLDTGTGSIGQYLWITGVIYILAIILSWKTDEELSYTTTPNTAALTRASRWECLECKKGNPVSVSKCVHCGYIKPEDTHSQGIQNETDQAIHVQPHQQTQQPSQLQIQQQTQLQPQTQQLPYSTGYPAPHIHKKNRKPLIIAGAIGIPAILVLTFAFTALIGNRDDGRGSGTQAQNIPSATHAVSGSVILTPDNPTATISVGSGEEGRVAITVAGGSAIVRSHQIDGGDPTLYRRDGSIANDDYHGLNWQWFFNDRDTYYAGTWMNRELVYTVTATFTDGVSERQINSVREGYIHAFPNISIGTAFDRFFYNRIWEHDIIWGEELVRFTGEGLMLDGAPVTTTILFELSPGGFIIYRVDFDGISQNDWMIADLIELIFEEASTSNTAAPSGQGTGLTRFENEITGSWLLTDFGGWFIEEERIIEFFADGTGWERVGSIERTFTWLIEYGMVTFWAGMDYFEYELLLLRMFYRGHEMYYILHDYNNSILRDSQLHLSYAEGPPLIFSRHDTQSTLPQAATTTTTHGSIVSNDGYPITVGSIVYKRQQVFGVSVNLYRGFVTSVNSADSIDVLWSTVLVNHFWAFVEEPIFVDRNAFINSYYYFDPNTGNRIAIFDLRHNVPASQLYIRRP